MSRSRADVLLLLAALIWGSAFVAQKEGSAYVGAFVFVGLRFLAAACILLPLALLERRRAPAPLARKDAFGALLIGTCLCAGCCLQQIGVGGTTATNAGFLTAAYVVLVPFVAWAFTRRPPRRLVLVAAGVALYGAWLLGGGTSLGAWSSGDLAVLLADLVWALHIALIAHFRGLTERPMLLSLLQCAITAAWSLPPALFLQPPGLAQLAAAWPAIAYAGIVSSGLAFTLQIVAQRHTPPAEAALIMSLECVFAAVAAAALLHESLGLRQSCGALLIVASIVLVEAGPLALVNRALPAREPS